MELIISNVKIYSQYEEPIHTMQSFIDSVEGKVFHSYDEMEEWDRQFSKENDNSYMEFNFFERLTEEEEEEEWNDTIRSAMSKSEATGIPFDHLMGMELAGIA